MGHTIMLYSLVAIFAGLALAVSGKCFFNSKIMYIFGAVITTIAFCIHLPLLSAYILEGVKYGLCNRYCVNWNCWWYVFIILSSRYYVHHRDCIKGLEYV